MKAKLAIAVTFVVGVGAVFFLSDRVPEAPLVSMDLQGLKQTDLYGFEELNSKMDDLSDSLRGLQQANQRQLDKVRAEKNSLIDLVKALEARVAAVETGGKTSARGSGDTGDDAHIKAETENLSGHTGAVATVTEVDLRHWMDDLIAMNYVDVEYSQRALSEVTETLERLPGVSVEAMQCGDGFCRAMFAQAGGEVPDISDVVGLPPFVGSGFTKPGDDGRLTVYFTDAGVSMRELEERLVADRDH
ncbi:hypothetical protein FKG94_19600 [Exilibacterium tricleocarpae]|uniref:Uncharacterized protein n=1 Tax=Exilibacterium tricleocarpae TaxID=2591008 RepID=A0A545T3Q5_9GAMM|nr:hypothetical protein [Exilibacterium tricleocarpae]TQV71849.1 hypothetical protein FKG94_19600 [Exilibacterium tricleocarpae]